VISGEVFGLIDLGYNPRSTSGKHTNHWNKLLLYNNKMKNKINTLSEQFQNPIDKS
jgi:hypothetical protein